MDVQKSLFQSRAVLKKLIFESTSALESLTNVCNSHEKVPLDLSGSLRQAVIELEANIELMSKYCAEVSANIMSLGSLKIPWLGSEVTKLDMSFLSGSDPWEFYINYTNQETKQRVTNLLLMKYRVGELSPKSPVKEKDIVAIYDGSKCYRALVTTVMEKSQRVRVLDVDTNKEGMVKFNNIYHMPSDAAAIPCQVLKCCLNVDDAHLRPNWCKELEIVFKETLADCYLTVDIIQKVDDGCPPKVLINLYAWNERLKKEINFSKWINNKLLTTIKAAISLDEDVMSYLSEAVIDPFYEECETTASSVMSEQKTFSECVAVSNSTAYTQAPLQNENELDEPDPESIDLAVRKVSSWMDKCSKKQNAILQQRGVNQVPQKGHNEPSFNVLLPSAKPFQPSSITVEPVVNVESQSSYKSYSESETSQSSAKRGNRTVISPDAPEFVPKCVYIDLCDKGDTSNVVANLEEEYQPTDERRICHLYQKRGFCDRIGCNKEHVKKTNKWTTDMEETNAQAYNTIDLPHENCTTVVKVQHIKNGCSFYATLSKEYSAISEHSVQETFEALQADINSPTNSSAHSLLKSQPSISQVVLALGLQRSLGPKRKWLRAVVTECLDDETVNVCFPDFGNVEPVKMNDLREIRPQFLHLPFQAVLMFLSGIKLSPDKERQAAQRLSSLIKGKYLKATVVSRDIFNSQLDVIAHTTDEICINNLMVDENLCLPV